MSANFWISSHCTQWLLTRAEWAQARNRDDPTVSPTDQDHLDFFYVEVMHSLGEMLSVRQQVIATACVYFRRFFTKVSWYSFDPYLVVLTVMYLAIKTEESGPVMIKHVLAAADKVWDKCRPMLSIKYTAAAVKECEFFVLEELGYSLVVYHAYRPLVGYAGESAVAKALLPLAWNFANDSLRTGLSVLYPPHMVAITCLHMASKINDVDISEWYSALQVNDAEISEIRAVMLQSYTLYKDFNKIKHIPPLLAKMKAKSDEMDTVAAEAAAVEADADADARAAALHEAAAKVTAQASAAGNAARDGAALAHVTAAAASASAAATATAAAAKYVGVGGMGGGGPGAVLNGIFPAMGAVGEGSLPHYSDARTGGGGGGAAAAAAAIAGPPVSTAAAMAAVAAAAGAGPAVGEMVQMPPMGFGAAGVCNTGTSGHLHPHNQNNNVSTPGCNAYNAGYTAALSYYMGAASALGMPP